MEWRDWGWEEGGRLRVDGKKLISLKRGKKKRGERGFWTRVFTLCFRLSIRRNTDKRLYFHRRCRCCLTSSASSSIA